MQSSCCSPVRTSKSTVPGRWMGKAHGTGSKGRASSTPVLPSAPGQPRAPLRIHSEEFTIPHLQHHQLTGTYSHRSHSCITGGRLSGAEMLPFPHNDCAELERLLNTLRLRYRRVLIVTEGLFSLDGDYPDLREMVRIKNKYKCKLFVDEAHSFGTLGAMGRGLCEHLGVDPKEVDVRIGTMSKTLASVGGFILGTSKLIAFLKASASGFIFSVGVAPAHCAAALEAVRLMTEDSSRTLLLQERSVYFYDLCCQAKIPIGPTTIRGSPVVVVIIGDSVQTAMASDTLAEKSANPREANRYSCRGGG